MTDTQSSLHAAATAKPPFYRDSTIVKWLAQLATLAAVIFALVFLVGEAGENLEAKSIQTGFDFLEVDPDIALGEGIDTDPATSGRASGSAWLTPSGWRSPASRWQQSLGP